MASTNVVLYWVTPEGDQGDGSRHEGTRFLQEAAAAQGIDLRPIKTEDIVIAHDGKTAEVRAGGSPLSPSTAFFHTKWTGSPADPAAEWRYLTTIASLEAAGFCVTVPALHTMTYGDRITTGLRPDWHGIPSIPSVRVCTREIGNAPERFEPSQWGLVYPLTVRAASWRGPEFTVNDAEDMRAILQMASASELTLSISAATGAEVRRVYCIGGVPYGCLSSDGEIRPVPEALLASARGIADELGLAFVSLEYHEYDGRYALAAVEEDQDDGLRIPALARARFGAYRHLFDRFAAGVETKSWVHRTHQAVTPVGKNDPAVMYWIRTDRDSKAPNPGHDAADRRFDLAGERARMRISPIAVDDIVVGHTGEAPQVLVHGKPVNPAETFFHTKLMSWPENRPDLWRHITTYCALEAAGFFTTVPALHSVINNDKLLSTLVCPDSTPTIATTSVHTGPFRDAATTFTAPFEFPVIVKPSSWGAGNSVFAVRSQDELQAVLRLAAAAELTAVVQPWLGTGVIDCRIYCVDGEPRGAAVRRPSGQNVTSNVGQGGSGEVVDLPPELVSPARDLAQAIGLPYACIDFLHAPSGWWFSEIELDGDTLSSCLELIDLRFGGYRLAFDRFVAGARYGWVFDRPTTQDRLVLRGAAQERVR